MTVRAPTLKRVVPEERADRPGTGASHRGVALWLLIAAIATLLLPIYRSALLLQDEAQRLEARADGLSATVTTMSDRGQATSGLQQALAAARSTASVLDGVSAAMENRYVDWPSLLMAVGGYDADRLGITSLSQEGRLLKVQGDASDDAAVVAYVDRLEASGLFARVSVQSIESLAGTPVATAAATLAATSAPQAGITPGATALPGDAYEAEDGAGSLIVMGAPQARTFHAAGDVDRARFTAKAGRTYRIRTEALEPGVDTALTVRLGWQVLVNDDQQPGVLHSEVILTAPRDGDLEGLVEVTNRGVSGPQQGYQLVLDEIVPTPTASPPAQTPAAPGQTATPTDSVPPTPQATPTFDLRDTYEPDDLAPPTIAVGSEQLRSFYPEGDVDQARFAGEAGRSYRVYTSGLAPDVDTFLVVQANSTVHVNDDVADGDRSSEVRITLAGDSQEFVAIEVTNRGRSGPAQWYRLGVEEVQAKPVPTGAAAATLSPVVASFAPSASPWERSSSAAPHAARQVLREGDGAMAALQMSRIRFVLLLELRAP